MSTTNDSGRASGSASPPLPCHDGEEPGNPSRQAPDGWSRRLLQLLLVLTFGTGIVDAVGYLALDHVFMANMTGNVAILGMAIAGGDHLPITGPLAALLCFTGGASFSGLSLRMKPAGWSHSVTVSLLLAGLLLGTAGFLALAVQDDTSVQSRVLLSSMSAVAMGIQAGTARKLAVQEMTTVVVTSTLTALAGELFFESSSNRLLNRRLMAITAILLGATVGALLINFGVGLALITSGVLVLAIALTGHCSAGARTPHQQHRHPVQSTASSSPKLES